jgi:hypothetical protein
MANQGWAPYVAAIAAVIAAVLTAVNLILTGKREQQTWVRSALESAFVDFLTASYNHKDACKRIVALRSAGRGDSARSLESPRRLLRVRPALHGQPESQSDAEEAAWSSIDEARQAMLDCISKLRVLSSDATAELARAVLQRNYEDVALIRSGDYKSFEESRAERKAAFAVSRKMFTDEAQRLLRVNRAHRPRIIGGH